MKKIILSAFLISVGFGLFAQPIPPPSGNNAASGHGLNGNQGAPIDGGLSILLIISAIYGSKKAYQFKKKKDIAV